MHKNQELYCCEWCEKQYIVPSMARACEDRHLDEDEDDQVRLNAG